MKFNVFKMLIAVCVFFSFSSLGVEATEGEMVNPVDENAEFSFSEVLPTEEELGGDLEGLVEGSVETSGELIIPPDLEPTSELDGIGGIGGTGVLRPTTPTRPGYQTDVNVCECGGSYSNPIRIKTSTIDMSGVPLEYGFYKGQFVIFERPELYYYKQNATQGQFNMITGQFVQKITLGYSTYVLFKGLDKIPYMARLFDKLGTKKPYNYGDYARGLAAWQVEHKVPLFGEILHTSVPTAGTKQVLVYVSKDNKKWQRRVLFTLKNKSVTYKSWYVK